MEEEAVEITEPGACKGHYDDSNTGCSCDCDIAEVCKMITFEIQRKTNENSKSKCDK